MCLSPITLHNKERDIDDNHTRIVPCGRCCICLRRRQNTWAFRLSEEMKHSSSACFITLTYETPPLSFNGHPTLLKKDFQSFMKRLRKKIKNSNIKYYMCGEYGTQTLRPHYHAIMFNLPHSYIQQPDKLTSIWSHGHIDIASCTIGSIRYVTKYVMKGRHEPLTDCDDRLPQFSLMSKKMGLTHLTPQMVKYYVENMIGHITLPGGALQPLPRYFKEKIFSKTERKQLSEEAELLRLMSFEKLFNNDYYNEFQWKKDQIRKHEKSILLERNQI